ncbi:MAG TPA: hypothetical protein VF703_04120 [Pyrinomonadaceae bacterium]
MCNNAVLNSEIENIRDTQTRQGWTSWGLVGGVVGALWLLSGELKSEKFQAEVIGTSILLFSTLIDAVRWLVSLLPQRRTQRDASIRFRWSNELFSGNELLFVFESLRSITLIVIAFFLASKWWFSLLAVSVAYGWYCVMAILWLILTLTEYPVRQGLTKLGIIYILIFVTACLASFFSHLYIAPFPVGEVIASYKVGGLFVVISYLVLLLVIVIKDSPVLQSLIEVRRNIAFNRIDIDSAVRQAEIALDGITVADALQREVNLILATVERLNQATDSLIFQVRTMQSHLPTPADSREVIQAKLNILTAHRSTCESIVRDREAALGELTSRIKPLFKRRWRIQGVIPEAADLFNQLDKGMNTILEDVDHRFASYQQLATKYDEQLQAISDALKLNLIV